jgi:dTDP-4-dehydrorhamnose reductase
VFSSHGHNFVKSMLRLAGEREELAVVSDQVGCPTPAADLAAATLNILSSLRDGRWGTYHFCGAGRTTWYGFAKEIFDLRSRITGLSGPRLRAITTADYPLPAPRPANSELDCSRFTAAFGVPQRPWSQGLAQVLDELLRA